MTAPLAGLRVIELARILAGPWAGQTLSDLGADVIKVEAPEGDDTRRWGPPFIDRENDRSAAYFHATNRGKKSVTVDFRTPEGQETVRRLVADADVVIENTAGQLVGVEVKAAATVKQSDLRGLRKLASLAGDQFKMGILLYDGDETMPLGDGIWAAPLSSLWGQ